jgi:hypothetical protein
MRMALVDSGVPMNSRIYAFWEWACRWKDVQMHRDSERLVIITSSDEESKSLTVPMKLLSRIHKSEK